MKSCPEWPLEQAGLADVWRGIEGFSAPMLGMLTHCCCAQQFLRANLCLFPRWNITRARGSPLQTLPAFGRTPRRFARVPEFGKRLQQSGHAESVGSGSI